MSPDRRAMLGEESGWEKSPVFRLVQIMCSGYVAGVRSVRGGEGGGERV